jgi:hypothetical protein
VEALVNVCPVCGLYSPDDSQTCDCGFDFATRLGGSTRPTARVTLLRLVTVCLAAVPGTVGVLVLYRQDLPSSPLTAVGWLAPAGSLLILGSLVDLRIEDPLPPVALLVHLVALGWSLAGSFGMWMVYQTIVSRI